MHMSSYHNGVKSLPGRQVLLWLASGFSLSPLPAWDSGRDFPSYCFSSLIMNGKACMFVFSISPPFLPGADTRPGGYMRRRLRLKPC